MPPFRVAFLGVDHPHGSGWRTLLAHLHDEIEITAVVPAFGGATESLEESLSGVPRFDTISELIADGDFDGAVVCLPNQDGPPAIVELAEAGRHILAEKPVAGSAADFQPVVEAIRRAGVAFQAGYMWRYDDCATRLRNMVSDGRFGKLISTETMFVTSDVKRRGPEHYLFDAEVSRGGFFNWLACHWLDLLFYVLQQPVVGVTARVGVFGSVPTDVEDGGAAIFDLADGSLATFVGGYWLPRWAGESHWSIRGAGRWVNWSTARAGTSGVLEIHGPMPQWFAMEETYMSPSDDTPGYGGRRGAALVRDWIAAARNGGDCRNTPESALATLALIDAIRESSNRASRVACQIGGGAS